MKYKKLFEPIKIGNVELKNRIIFPPVSTNFASADGHLTDKFIKHYARRANGHLSQELTHMIFLATGRY